MINSSWHLALVQGHQEVGVPTSGACPWLIVAAVGFGPSMDTRPFSKESGLPDLNALSRLFHVSSKFLRHLMGSYQPHPLFPGL